MVEFIIRRLLWAVVLLFAITLVCFALFFLVPSDPGTTGRGTARDSVNLRESVEINGPLYKQYELFLIRIGQGSFGESWVNERDVGTVLKEAMPVTISLVVGGAIMWLLIAIPIGILSALRPRSLLDRLATIFVLIGLAAHPVWLGLVLSYTLGYKAHIFPVGGGYCDLANTGYYCSGFTQWFWHLILAVVHLRHALRRALRTDDPRERHRDDERGLRAHGARKGGERRAGAALARPAERDAPGRDDARDGRRLLDGERAVHRDGLQPARRRPLADAEPCAARLTRC